MQVTRDSHMMANNKIISLLLLGCIIVLCLALFFVAYLPVQGISHPLPPTITQIDHLMVQVPDSATVYRIFSEELELPVAWQMVDYGSFSTGGVSFGNVNMELLESSWLTKLQGQVPWNTGIVGIAFEPSSSLEATTTILEKGGVAHSAVMPFNTEMNGTRYTLWNNLNLERFMPGSMIFYCKYTFDQDKFRQHMQSALASKDGGPLGVIGLKEIVIEYADEPVLQNWQMLVPAAPGDQPYLRNGGNGIIIRLIRSDRNAISSIVVQVKSLERAKTVLQEKGLLGTFTNRNVTINPSAVSGLQVSFTE